MILDDKDVFGYTTWICDKCSWYGPSRELITSFGDGWLAAKYLAVPCCPVCKNTEISYIGNKNAR